MSSKHVPRSPSVPGWPWDGPRMALGGPCVGHGSFTTGKFPLGAFQNCLIAIKEQGQQLPLGYMSCH